ncbi:hypothetical protein ACN28S_18280 [Cystobacter fuscus]
MAGSAARPISAGVAGLTPVGGVVARVGATVGVGPSTGTERTAVAGARVFPVGLPLAVSAFFFGAAAFGAWGSAGRAGFCFAPVAFFATFAGAGLLAASGGAAGFTDSVGVDFARALEDWEARGGALAMISSFVSPPRHPGRGTWE